MGPPLLGLGWLATEYAVWLCALCTVVGVPTLVLRRPSRAVSIVGAVVRELAIVLGLYSLWGFAGQLAAAQPTGAFRNGIAVWDAQRWLHLPNEKVLQDWVLPHVWFVKSMNLYYAGVHGTSLFIFLIWLFFRHRSHYPEIRNTLSFLTLSCLLIQLNPVAPPRLIPELNMVDTAIKYGQSVYPSVGAVGPDQFSAMPSLHIGWAALFTFAVIKVSPSKWRWLTLAHLILTFAAVTFTANHYWLDGIVAIILIAPAAALARGVTHIAAYLRRLWYTPSSVTSAT